MAEASEDVLRALQEFLHTSGDLATMREHWSASPYQDAWLVRPKAGSFGGHLFLVRGQDVEPLQLARTTLDEAYARLRAEDGG